MKPLLGLKLFHPRLGKLDLINQLKVFKIEVCDHLAGRIEHVNGKLRTSIVVKIDIRPLSVCDSVYPREISAMTLTGSERS